ncbi:Flagellar motor switch protein FliM [Pseudoprimorskyibacter insulae]|uniref:Flagellar motor switch protein FliM n=2 Tax=Pseudoprimorskyibacter insulae TaxID=1695997 RepID=A0A2R8AVX9_9RHOB|nr:flagellar motor switch protein FliM [Pseudoprimorskyibacter insulae]SPF80087.1 Flagellar motor switch protein FliM [Pseudoprimorskyibacter insulae]
MASPSKLSSNEVAALVDGLKNLDAGEGGDGSHIRPYKFGTDNRSILGDYYGLRMINERFCRLARSVFLPFLRMHPRISSFPPEVKTFDHYCDELENFVSLTTSKIDELRGSQMIVLAPNFVSLLTDAYYGGAIQNLPTRRTEFTATETRVIEIVTNGLNKALEMAWRDLTHLTFQATNHEENLQFATFVESSELVVNCSFIIQLPDTDPANLDILYPLQTLKPLAAQLRSRMQSDLVDDDITWRQRLERAVMNVPLEITARLADPTVNLAQLNGLKPGKLVTCDLKPNPTMLVEGSPMFAADLGEVGGRSALSITRRIKTPQPGEDQ